ncbi:MAG: 16S rRNA (cytosine(967)-C(5))-methyltransferase RsmB [Methylococcales bacterium]|nr:16S rRNA (cytosine(967)-C(5))-methyltransferase RsmB [Methylococcales bacterium]MBT7442746.1 16S rRNA (cytosine(967)-C(5))-methyltransferase RsmB [Methylococcales bacterium]
MNKQPRVAAVHIVRAVLSGQSLTAAFDHHLKSVDLSQQPFVKAICFGTIRHYLWLECLLAPLLQKPLKAKDSDVKILMLLGLHELSEQKTADYAVVSETVNAVKPLKKMWAKGLVNAVLRNFLRQQPELMKGCDNKQEAIYRHPYWLIKILKTDWPDEWAAILTANNQPPPMVLRVNQQKTTRDDYLALLKQAKIDAEAQPVTAMGVRLQNPVDVSMLPHFAEGWCSVQDGAAQMAAELLQLAPGQRVLDACAAPGGKTCHIAETEPKLTSLLAVDSDAERLPRLVDNLQRLSLQADWQVSDFSDPGIWPEETRFDRILLDAPCSGTGVIRRHPDIKMLRNKDDIVALSQLQHTMLENAWSVLKEGGRLVYATCSILKQENEHQISRFLETHSDAHCDVVHRILPGDQNRDGFYYACLNKE